MTPRRWLQFNLKSLLILVLIVALPCSWLAWKMDRKRRERAAVAEIKKLGGWVLYDGEDSFNESKPPGPRWLRQLLGDDFFGDVVEVRFEENPNGGSDLTDANLALLTALSGLKRLHLHTTITDASVVHLERLQRLEELHIGPIGPPGMSRAGFSQLKTSLPRCEFFEMELIHDDLLFLDEQPSPSEEPAATVEPPTICPPFLTTPAQ